MGRNSIYYAFGMPPVTGGDFVAVEHVEGLNRLGFDARVFYGAGDDGWQRFPVPVTRMGAPIRPDDIVVMGENQPFGQIAGIDCIKVLHNQNPYLTFFGFESVAALNAAPLAHILVPSDFCAARLCELGVGHPVSRVRPGLPAGFAPAEKKLQIAYSPAKRAVEASYVKGCFQALAPEYAHVPWVALTGMTRAACGAIMAQSAVYAAFAQLESLGLMSLEAMAAGCDVVGFTGYGGAEYATSGNGDWIAEGDFTAFAMGLGRACRRFETSGFAPEAGLATAAQFSRDNFDAELQSAWLFITGDKVETYRK